MAGRVYYNHSSNFMAFDTNGSEAARIASDGRVHMGTTATLQSASTASNGWTWQGNYMVSCSDGDTACILNRTSSVGNIAQFRYIGAIKGSIDVSTSGTSYNTSSDARLKENVADMTGAITRVKALAPKRFNFIADADTTVDGFLAHEAQAVVPEAVTGTHNEVDEDGNAVMQGIDQSKLVPLLTGALQEAIAKIEDLETRLAALEGA
jgi:hypothetical protein